MCEKVDKNGKYFNNNIFKTCGIRSYHKDVLTNDLNRKQVLFNVLIINLQLCVSILFLLYKLILGVL